MTTSQRTVIPDSIRTNGATPNPWWSNAVVYQIYPRSFQDTNGDGLGDLKGITSRLDYLADLGVDVLWLSPVYKSPQDDNGYDISDYQDIDPLFGTLDDMDELLAEAHKRGLKIVMDLVVNHTSDEHAWFEASKNKDDEHADWYWWRPARPGTTAGEPGAEPNQCGSYFGGSAWEYCPERGEYYLHQFSKKQPDLNWENPAVRRAVDDMMNWWLDRGIAGFRIDAIINIKKDLTWEDLPVDGPDGRGFLTNSITRMQKRDGGTKNGIGVFLRELKERCFAPHDAFTVGEVFEVDREQLEEFIGEDGYFSTMFAFDPIQSYKKGTCQCEFDRNMNPDEWKRDVFVNQKLLGDIAFEANIIENHDMARGATIYIPDEDYGFASISALAGLQVLQRGMPFLYQGQEIGMTNCPFELEDIDDIMTLDNYRYAVACGFPEEKAFAGCARESRDNARTPMQWSDAENAGFTTGKPWLKVNPNYPEINVARQEKEYGSVLNFYRRLLCFRKSEEYRDLLTYGTFEPMYEDQERIFAFKRTLGKQCLTVICNESSAERFLTLKEDYEEVVFVNLPQVTRIGDNLILHPYQLIVVETTKK